jgi:hypothetical protein
MMDIPTAAFLSTCVVTGGGLALKVVSSITARPKTNGNGNGNGKCPLHADIEKRLKDGDDRMDALLQSSRTTRKLVIAIAAHLNIPIGNLKEELQDVMEGD